MTEKTIIITWPFVQGLFELEGFRDNAALCSSEELYDRHGDSAFAVSKRWLEEKASDSNLSDLIASVILMGSDYEEGPDTDFEALRLSSNESCLSI